MSTMKAAVVPGPGQVQVRMQTSGVCHTDIHLEF